VLQSKCLVGEGNSPNACVQTLVGWNILPVLYWVSYTLFITFMLMNLVVAVILEGYEEGKASADHTIIDRCIACWKKRDPDQTMMIPLRAALEFINEVMEDDIIPSSVFSSTAQFGVDFSQVKLSSTAGALDLAVSPDGHVHFMGCFKQVLRFQQAGSDPENLRELESCRGEANKAELAWWRRGRSKSLLVDPVPIYTVRHEIAAMTLQSHLGTRVKAWRARASTHCKQSSNGVVGQAAGSCASEQVGEDNQPISGRSASSLDAHRCRDSGRGEVGCDQQGEGCRDDSGPGGLVDAG